MALGVPVMVTLVLPPEQKLVLPLMLAVGKGLTVIAALPKAVFVQDAGAADTTLTKV
jgi:hypothetical protein